MENNDSVLWLNGNFIPLSQAAVSPMDRGFLYGDGLFETLRAEKGNIFYLRQHLKRLFKSAKILRINLPDSFDWEGITKQVLKQNVLLDTVSRVKILITRGTSSGLGLPRSENPTICISAAKYAPPQYQKGWKLHIYRNGFTPPLSEYKSLNYLFFMIAKQAALDAEKDEAVILGPDGTISETSTGSLLIQSKGIWWTPKNFYKLPGITLEQLIRLFEESGRSVEMRTAFPNDILSAETIWVLNSLMGIMPICEIDDQALKNLKRKEAALFRERLFEI
ncbi:Aminodeoxychorismate lyase [Candidatus Magnetomoraceae bacterium gMMP-13]